MGTVTPTGERGAGTPWAAGRGLVAHVREDVTDRLRCTWESWSRVPPPQQGRHPDPLADDVAVDSQRWSFARRRAWAGPEMAAFRAALALPGSDDVRRGVLDDLATYYGLTEEECRLRCIDWEAASVAEWEAGPRTTDEGRLQFYRSTTSWAFDLLWWAYLQAEGMGDPQTVLAVQLARRLAPAGRHLDFGSGVGVTAQVFSAFGFRSDLADISSTLLDFARFRLGRRDVRAGYLDLAADDVPVSAYSVVTAIDTLAHVPDVAATAQQLHASLLPGGLLFAGIDARPPAPESGWHLVDDEWSARQALQRVGFAPVRRLGPQLLCYRRVDARSVPHQVRSAVDGVWLTSGLGRSARRAVVSGVRAARDLRS
jgi:SAM-dependent methyltransferase